MPTVTMLYLDYNATTPLLPEVLDAMLPYLTSEFGNPSSAHRLGSRARCAVEDARDQVAALLGGHSDEIVFTSGGTEANNLAIEGLARAHGMAGHAVTTAIEHSSVLAPLARLETLGWKVTRLPVDGEGRVSDADVAGAMTPETVFASIGWANNEIGSIQPVAAIGAACRARGVPLHVDAVQAAGKLPVNGACADLLSLSAHKLGGPKGAGALYVRRGVRLAALLLGGSQERERRAGTENTAAVVGFGAACVCAAGRLREAAAVEQRRERLWDLLARVPGVERNSPSQRCLCNTLNVGFRGRHADALIAALDLRGIAVSSGSACAAGASEPSHVLRALGREAGAARDAIRFSLGFDTSEAEIADTAAAVSEICGAHAAGCEVRHA